MTDALKSSTVGATGSYPSVCPLDCADTCSLTIEVDEGRVRKVRGGRGNPFTRGKICAKVAQGLPHQVHGPDRLTTPLLNNGPKGAGHYRAIDWDQAVDLIHERFSAIIERFGAQAIAPLTYGGPMGLLANGSMDARFFHRLGSSKVDSTPLCAGTSSAAWESVYGDTGGIPYTEMAHSKLIVVWGNNITACHLHLTTLIREARRGGAKLVVVDPKRTRIADDADLHLPLLPGSDVVLAYAVARELGEHGGLDHSFLAQNVHGVDEFMAAAEQYSLDRAAKLCGLEPQAIAQFARWWRELCPAAISLGVAPERNRNGGSGVRAILALPALTGNIGPIGAGVCDVSSFFPVRREALSRPDLAPEDVRELNVLDIPSLVSDPGEQVPLKALFIYNHNPVAVHPEQSAMRAALQSDDVFVVGHDISMTDSMRCADLVLPAASHLEYGDLYKAYGHAFLQRSEAVIKPVGEALSNTDLFRRLAKRFAFTERCFTDSDVQLMDQAIDPEGSALEGRKASELLPGDALDMSLPAPPVLMRGIRPDTPSAKIELCSTTLAEAGDPAVPQYAAIQSQRRFTLVSPASERRINSTLGGLEGHDRDIVCEMSPEDAAELGLTDGQSVCLQNDQGEVELVLAISDRMRPRVIYVPKGAWLKDSASNQTVNALIPGHRSDLASGACYYDCTVDVVAAGHTPVV
ncbi:MAG: molybdopterin-dependent oxidoreductase [Pseudomonadota bacterium]